MKSTGWTTVLILIGSALGTAPALGQGVPGSSAVQEQGEAPGPPSSFQIAAGAQVLADSAAQAEQRVLNLGAMAELTADVAAAERRHGELRALFDAMTSADFVRLERLSRLRDQAQLEDGRLETIRGRLVDRLERLGALDAEWSDRRQQWRSRLEALRAEADGTAAEVALSAGQARAALDRIDSVLRAATAAAAAPMALQGRVEALRERIRELGDTITAIQARRRQALLAWGEPVLFSAEHRAQLREGGWRAWDPAAGIELDAYRAFARDNAGMLLFHALLALLVGATVRFGRRMAGRAEATEWSGLLEHPWAMGLFVSALAAMGRITLAPPLWDVLLWAVFGATAAILGRRLFEARAVRLMIYLAAAFYPAFLLLEVGQLPEPVFRVGLALVAAMAIPLFLLLAFRRLPVVREEPGAGGGEPARKWPLLMGAAVWVVVLACLILGLDALARWTLHVTVMSGAVAYTVTLGFAMMGASSTTFKRLDATGSLLHRAGVLLAQRLILIGRVVLALVGVLILLDVWGLTGSPVTTWQWIMSAGFTAGTFHLTVGRVVIGAVVVYLAVLVSGLFRSLMTPGHDPRAPEGPGRMFDHDPGLGASITRLAQYAFVALGTILALGIMGFQLQNFAIITGALGIGVGFGLQNVVNNFASGLILLFERPVRVGDAVVVGNVWGTIQKIGLRSTILLTLDQSEMIVPNGDLVSEKVINWTLTDSRARLFLPLGVAYGSPVARVLEILEETAAASAQVLEDPRPEALFMEFGDSSLNFELRVWVKDVRQRLAIRSAVLTDLDRRLRDAGIEIPFPQRDLHLRSIDPEALKTMFDRPAPEPDGARATVPDRP